MVKSELEKQLREYHKEAYLWSTQCCNYDEDEAKDVLQNAYLKILEGKARYQSKASFKTWLFSIIRFTAIDLYRKTIEYESLTNVEVIEEGIESERSDLRAMLEKLPPKQQEVMLLSFYHEMTLEEIAKVMDLHIGTVRTHYSRGKDSMRAMIKKEEV